MKHLQRIRTWLGTPLATLTARRPKLARFVKFAGAMAVIVGAEMALPSTALTGKPHPTPTPEPRHIDALPMTQAQMTYGDVAGSADWLWRLGTLTQAQVAEKLGTDIALLEQRLKGEEVPSQGYYPLTPGRAEETFRIGLEGMRQARDDLATFFEDGDKKANAVQDFILLRMQAAAYKHQSARFAEKTAAEQAYSAHRATMEEDAAISSDPVAVKLAQASGDANRAWLDASSVLNRFQRKSRTALSAPGTLNQRHPFPNFQQPIPLFEQRLRVAALFMPRVDTGPDRANGAVGHWRAFKRALTGAVRSTEDQFSHIRCALVFPPEQSGTTAMPVCAVSTPLPIDYDLTGQGCASDTMAAGEVVDLVTSGTHIAGDLCKESWSYPHLSILFTPDSFTVYPPLPAGMQTGDTAPLSLWSMTWAGEEHLLDQPRRFPWDGELLPFNELGMIHDVKPGVRTPRIWNDFNAARPGTDIAAAITGGGADDRHSFSPRNHATLVASSRFLQPMALLNLGADPVASNVSAFLVRRALTDQQEVLKDVAGRLRRENLNNIAGFNAINAQFCKFGNMFVSPRTLGTDRAQMQALAASVPGPECEVYYAHHTILDQVLRASHAGSWLWLLES